MFFTAKAERIFSRSGSICAYGSLDDNLKLSQRQMPIFVLIFSCSYEFLTSCFSNTAFKKLTNVGGMSDYFENLNLGKTTCFKEFKSGTIININHNFVLVIITKFSKRHFCG